jgi:hypothetical protein
MPIRFSVARNYIRAYRLVFSPCFSVAVKNISHIHAAPPAGNAEVRDFNRACGE